MFRCFSPAHFGAAKGQLSELKLLAENGGNLWLVNAKGDYPIHDAVNSSRRDLVKWLLSTTPPSTLSGASGGGGDDGDSDFLVNVSNKDGRCLLHIAASTGMYY